MAATYFVHTLCVMYTS